MTNVERGEWVCRELKLVRTMEGFLGCPVDAARVDKEGANCRGLGEDGEDLGREEEKEDKMSNHSERLVGRRAPSGQASSLERTNRRKKESICPARFIVPR